MGLKAAMRALTGKKTGELAKKEAAVQALITNDNFPVIRPSERDMTRYKRVPLMGIAAMGAAFSGLPDAARAITTTVTTNVVADGPLFVGINPKGIEGFLRFNEDGTVGNILQINEQGKEVIAGRMRFKALENGLPVTETTKTMVPFDPMTMVIAAALFSTDQKLSSLQQKAEEILQFLKLEKQSRQRGNMNMLSEILEEYRQNCSDEKQCNLRNIEVQTIKREAHQDMLFYQEQIARQLQEQKGIHIAQQAQSLLDAVTGEFYEYQLACYLYSFSSFMDAMLQKNFDSAALEAAAQKMTERKKCYDDLYSECHAQIANYQRTAVEARLLGGLGNAAKSVGRKLASVPVLRGGPIDEALISAGESIGKMNRETVAKKLEAFASLEDRRMTTFIESLHTLDHLYNRNDGMLTDGTNLYILEAV